MSQGPLRFFYIAMTSCILVIDGENFLHKVEEVLKKRGIEKDKVDLASISLNKLFKEPLKGFKISRKIFYAARLHVHRETKRKSGELIRLQRKLSNNLIKQGYEFVIAGNVRAQKVNNKIVFREKGVDVKIAVDLVSLASEGRIVTAILCSSDSDLQPAVKELQNRRVQVVYLGFETNPNKGLSYTSNRIILLRNSKVIEAVNKA